jgi:hypothetical protein
MSRFVRRLSKGTACLGGVALVAAACGGPSLPALSDPIEIIEAGLATTEAARTVHLEVVVDGDLRITIPGATQPATTIKLGGTSASADVDLAGGRARATFAAPGLLILSGEAIQIAETTYLRTSLSGPMFDVIEATDALPVDPADASGIFDDLRAFLRSDGLDPVRGDDVECGGTRCYAVLIELTTAELEALGDAAPLPALPDDMPDLPIDLNAVSLAATVRVEKETHRLAGISLVTSLGETGSITVDVSASNWDQPMDISPPPASEIKPST